MKKLLIISFCVLCVVLSIGYYSITAMFEYKTNDYVKEKYDSGDMAGLLDFYLTGDPLMEGRPFIGNKSPITMIAVTDFKSDSSASFFKDLYPQLRTQYIESGQASFYEKYYMTQDEYDQKRGRFIYVVSVSCIQEIGQPTPKEFENFHLSMFNLASKGDEDVSSLANAAAEAGFTKYLFIQCIDRNIENPPGFIYEDVVESELFRIQSPSLYIGVGGGDNSVFFGIPTIAQVTTALRQKQIVIGI